MTDVCVGSLDRKTFETLRRFVYEKSGITLGETKRALVSARLSKRMRVLGIADYDDYLGYVMDDQTGIELTHLLDAISTNVTSFYRESEHFEFTARVFAEWLDQGQRRFRFWSAASSTGEEPYTLAMTLLDTAGSRSGIDMKILATDINTQVLAKCRDGKYPEDKIKTVPEPMKSKYFERVYDKDGETFYTAKQSLKSIIVFRRLNLSQPPFPMKGPLDIIFCRNVMIYFDNTVRKNMLADMHRLLKPGGYLMVGHAESLTGLVKGFNAVKPSIYKKV